MNVGTYYEELGVIFGKKDGMEVKANIICGILDYVS